MKKIWYTFNLTFLTPSYFERSDFDGLFLSLHLQWMNSPFWYGQNKYSNLFFSVIVCAGTKSGTIGSKGKGFWLHYCKWNNKIGEGPKWFVEIKMLSVKVNTEVWDIPPFPVAAVPVPLVTHSRVLCRCSSASVTEEFLHHLDHVSLTDIYFHT